MAHVVDGLGRVVGFQGFQRHPVMHLHRRAQVSGRGMLVDASFQVAYEAGNFHQFLIGDLLQAEGRHLEPGVSDLVYYHRFVVSWQCRGDGCAFGVLPVACGAPLGDIQGMAGRIRNGHGGRGRRGGILCPHAGVLGRAAAGEYRQDGHGGQ